MLLRGFLLIVMTSFCSYVLAKSTPFTITSKEVAKWTLGAATQIKLSKLENQTAQASFVRSHSPYDTTFETKITSVNDRTISLSPFSPQKQTQRSFEVSSRKYLGGGFALYGGLIGSYFKAENAPPSPDIDSFGSTFVMGARQSLYKDFAGKSDRLQREIAEDGVPTTSLNVEDQVTQYLIEVLDTYYNTWKAKAQLNAQEQAVKRQKRLLDITEIKFRRGTSEKSELLQIESSYSEIADQREDAKKALLDIWRLLLVTLNSPAFLQNVDPLNVEPKTENHVVSAERACSSASTKVKTKRIQAIQRQITTADKGVALAKEQGKADLYLDVNARANGIGDSYSEATKDNFEMTNPRFEVKLGLNWTIGDQKAKADLIDALRSKNAITLQKVLAEDTSKVQLQTYCTDLKRQKQKSENFKKVVEKQSERLVLEEDRFALGRIDALNVIGAADDLTARELAYQSSLIEQQRVAWHILYLTDRIDSYLK